MVWTSEQEKAITMRNCGLIVSAAAGSGKTSVLVERLIQILMDDAPETRIPANWLVVVTFTSDAASEVKIRLTQTLEKQLQQQPENNWLQQQQILLQSAHISTISSFCFDFIRDNLTDQEITSGFRILSEAESSLIEAKAADQVLNDWHITHSAEMEYLWRCFCETNDQPIEKILMDLHHFLSSVPFRKLWKDMTLKNLKMPLNQSIYCKQFIHQLHMIVSDIITQNSSALELSYDLYPTLKENTLYTYLEKDYEFYEGILQEIEIQSDLESCLLSLLEIFKNRKKNQFPRKKKTLLDVETFDQIKEMRKQYKKKSDYLVKLIQSVQPFAASDLEEHCKIVPLLFEMEEDVANAIWAEKVQKNALSFEDGERLVLEMLTQPNPNNPEKMMPSPLAKEMSEFYQLIMIDEYQDSNNKQDQIFKLLSQNAIDPETGDLRYGSNIFLVGDVKQSIYRFRLANPQNFVRAISESSQKNSLCQHIVLNQNFRSAPSVLSFVNFICGNLMSTVCGDVQYDATEALYLGSKLFDDLPIEDQTVQIAILRDAPNDQSQHIQYAIRIIQNKIRSMATVVDKDGIKRPCRYSDFSILVRNNKQCQNFIRALKEADIPVQNPEEKAYLKAKEVQILLNMLRVLDNPLLDTSMAAVMLSPMFWFTAQELLQIRMTSSKQQPLYLALCQQIGVTPEETNSSINMVLLQKCRRLYDTIQKLRQASSMMTLESLIRKIYDMTDFISVIQLTDDGSHKRANLELLLQYAKQYEKNTDSAHKGISGFLNYVDWLLENGKDFQQMSASASSENVVTVKTMHKSKGLEYPFVILGCIDSTFSKEDRKKTALFSSDGKIGFRIKDPETFINAKTLMLQLIEEDEKNNTKSEELRLLYVAMTRAKQQLWIPISDKPVSNFTQYAASITSNGTIPPSMVQSANSMAEWIWMCMLLLHPIQLEKIVELPKIRWKRPAWSEKLYITFTDGLPEKSEVVLGTQSTLEETQVDHAKMVEMQRVIQHSCRSADSDKQSLLSASKLQEIKKQQVPTWKRPVFLQQKSGSLTGAERGTAIHSFFEYANFHNARQDLFAELKRLVQCGFLTETEAATVTTEIVDAFFHDPIFTRMEKSRRVLREQKFLVRCNDLNSDKEMAEILSQYQDSDSMIKGIIDLAFQEEDQFILMDYKTDYVVQAETLVEHYREQLMIYKAAIFCITGLPVSECYLYSTHLKKSILVY